MEFLSVLRRLCALILIWVNVLLCLAEQPSISDASSWFDAKAKSIHLTFKGSGLDKPTAIWTSFTQEPIETSHLKIEEQTSSSLRCVFAVTNSVSLKLAAARVASMDGISNLRCFVIDDLRAIEAKTNSTRETALDLKFPVSVEGNCESRAYRYFKIEGRKGHSIAAEVFAARTGSQLDPVIRLLDTSGHELAYDDDDENAGADSVFHYKFKANGTCFLELRDIRYQGGSDYRYHLRLTSEVPEQRRWIATFPLPPGDAWTAGPQGEGATVREVEPNNGVTNANAVTVPSSIAGKFEKSNDRDFYRLHAEKGNKLVVTGHTRSVGSPCDLYFALLKPDGTIVTEANIAGPDGGVLTNNFKESGEYYVVAEELNRRGNTNYSYRLDFTWAEPGFTLSTEADGYSALPGGTFEVKITPVRTDYGGEIEIAPVESTFISLQTTNRFVTSKTNATSITLNVPADARPGSLHTFRLRGSAKIKDRDTTAPVSTAPAWKKVLPGVLIPPSEFEGLIWVAIKTDDKKAESRK